MIISFWCGGLCERCYHYIVTMCHIHTHIAPTPTHNSTKESSQMTMMIIYKELNNFVRTPNQHNDVFRISLRRSLTLNRLSCLSWLCVCVWTNELLLQSQLNFSWAKLFPYHVSESYCNATPFTIGKVSWVCLQSKCCEFYIRASTQHTVCTPLHRDQP